ncbi:zinc-binding dehydrogenase [Neobacillus sp. PS3-34]|uniref:zinc-binding dehydrogenase n=1 Tax=Neobacillus sp. PS3-34 TaxID=3070678 RepID=UPI0027E16D61|nr:zinc-binding dehydrogenase [Neobacillus sp. PS3-34]WML48969.1 zinc-binding dehydrogenase [Neobacillus sp. PS3-34]
MKAAVLQEKGQFLQITDMPAPTLLPGSVRVKVTASHILSFSQYLFGGQIPVPLPTPYIPGPSAIGIVEEVANDVSGIEIGQKVFCNPYITSKEQTGVQDAILKGWFGLTPNSGSLLETWKQGSFAEQAVYPVENVTPISGLDHIDDSKLAAINYMSIAYSGFQKGTLQPGQSVLINGATGNMGAAAVLVALAMGAATVYAVGRNADVLKNLQALDVNRVFPIVLEGSEEEYSKLLLSKANGVDLVLDALGTVLTPHLTAAAISTLRPKGTAVFVGGVFTDIPISYYDMLIREITVTGSFMYPVTAPKEIVNMIRANTLSFEAVKTDEFVLQDVNEAVTRATQLKGLHYSVLTPQK